MDTERIFTTLDKIQEDVSELKVTSAKQEENLKEHIRRTELAEQNISLLRKEIEPVKAHVGMMNAALKIIGLVSVFVSITVGIFQIVNIIVNIGK